MGQGQGQARSDVNGASPGAANRRLSPTRLCGRDSPSRFCGRDQRGAADPVPRQRHANGYGDYGYPAGAEPTDMLPGPGPWAAGFGSGGPPTMPNGMPMPPGASGYPMPPTANQLGYERDGYDQPPTAYGSPPPTAFGSMPLPYGSQPPTAYGSQAFASAAPTARGDGSLPPTLHAGLPPPGSLHSLPPTMPGGLQAPDASVYGVAGARMPSMAETLPDGMSEYGMGRFAGPPPRLTSEAMMSQPPTAFGGVPAATSPMSREMAIGSRPPTMPGGLGLPPTEYGGLGACGAAGLPPPGSLGPGALPPGSLGGLASPLGALGPGEPSHGSLGRSGFPPGSLGGPSASPPGSLGPGQPAPDAFDGAGVLPPGSCGYGSPGPCPGVERMQGRPMPLPPPAAPAPFGSCASLGPSGAGGASPSSPPRLSPTATSAIGRVSGALYVRILAARRLRNGDTGLFGDVSDPYVVVRLGPNRHRTPIVENDLNPVWENGNEFVLPVTGKDGELLLEVMNSNVVQDSRLGIVAVALWNVRPGSWQRFNKQLKDTNTGELEFEVRFDPGVAPPPSRALSPGLGPRQRGQEQKLLYTLEPHNFHGQPRPHALPMEGVRVLEIARRTWTAALCGRMLASCGADVVRIASGEEALVAMKRMRGAAAGGVYGDHSAAGYDRPPQDPRSYGDRSRDDSPGGRRGGTRDGRRKGTGNSRSRERDGGRNARGGDPYAFGPDGQALMEPHRRDVPNPGVAHMDRSKPSTIPTCLHAGKRIAPHNDGPHFVEMIRRDLLPTCDVLLTDLPKDELEELGLGFQHVRQDYPGMIYAHTSCIGINADLQRRGVEDAGAFFCLTGFAEQLGHFLGPRGFAASTSASALFGLICMALMRRRCGGTGDRVELSILRAGKLCTALGALTGWVRGMSMPKQQQQQREQYAPEETPAPPSLPFDVLGAAQVAIGRRPLPTEMAPAFVPPHQQHHHQLQQQPPWGAPMHHGFGWNARHPAMNPPRPQLDHPITGELPLERVTVIEFGDGKNISAATLGSMLADLGAQVTKVERPKFPDPWQRQCPELYKDLNCRKLVQSMDFPSLQAEAALFRTLADTTIFITNLPSQALEAWGLSPQKLRATFPHLVIVLITQWGCDEVSRAREFQESRKGGQEVRAFWQLSGLSSRCFMGREMPPGLAEISVSQHALAGLGLALVRQQLTGSGQLVHVGHYQAGLFSLGISEAEAAAPGSSPLLRTRDNRFMRLLGRGHRPHDAWMLLHAVGRRESIVERFRGSAELIRQHLSEMTWEDVQRSHDELADCAAQWRYDELSQAFEAKGIDWHCEELRPVDAEGLHQARKDDLVGLKRNLEETAQKHQITVEKVEALERQAADVEGRRAMLSQQSQQQDHMSLQGMEASQMQVERELQDITHRMNDLQEKERQLRNQPPPQNLPPYEQEGLKQRQGQELQGIQAELQHLHQQKVDLQHRRETGSLQLQHHDDHRGVIGELRVRVIGAKKLKNMDTGLFGDVSDPYVIARMNGVEQKTPVIDNNLNPKWEEGNVFTFPVRSASDILEFRVMNSNKFRDDCLGFYKLGIDRLPRVEWQEFSQKLEEGSGGSIQYHLYLDVAEQFHLNLVSQNLSRDLAEARRERDTLSAQVKALDSQIEMADYATQWLMDVPSNTAVPMSVGEKNLLDICGNRNIVMPAFLVPARRASTKAANKRMSKPHMVSLFPEKDAGLKPPKIRVNIRDAKSLRSHDRGTHGNVLVTCEILGKPMSVVKTKAFPADSDTIDFKFNRSLKGFVPGDILRFTAFSSSTVLRSDGQKLQDQVCGSSDVPSEAFYPNGFQGTLDLGHRATLKVMITVEDEGE